VGLVFEHTPGGPVGQDPCIGSGVTSLAIAGNGDVIMFNQPAGALYEHTPGTTGPSPQIGSGVTQFAIAGNGDVIMFNSSAGLVYEHTPGGPVGNDPCIGSGVTSMAIAGNGDVIMFTTGNTVNDHIPGGSVPDQVIGSGVKFFAIGDNGHVLMLNNAGDLYDQGNPRVPGASTKVEQFVDMFAPDGHGGLYVLQFGQLFDGPEGATVQQTELSRIRGPVGNNGALDGNVVEIAPDGHGGLYVLFSGNDLWDITYAGGVRASQWKVTSDSVQDFYFDDAGNLHWDKTPSFWQKVGDFFANLGKDLVAFELAYTGVGFIPTGGGSLGQRIFGNQYLHDAVSGGIIVGAAAVTYFSGGALSEITGPIIAGAIGGAAGSAFSEVAKSILFHTSFDWQSIAVGAALGAVGGGLKWVFNIPGATGSGTPVQGEVPLPSPDEIEVTLPSPDEIQSNGVLRTDLLSTGAGSSPGITVDQLMVKWEAMKQALDCRLITDFNAVMDFLGKTGLVEVEWYVKYPVQFLKYWYCQ
jgi:hypothetical protein